MKFNTKQLFSTDLNLFELLKNSTDPIIKLHSISEPSEAKLQTEDYGIFIGETTTKPSKNANKVGVMDVNVVLTVSSKEKDYIKAKTQIDRCTRQVIKQIMQDKELSFKYKGFNQSVVVNSSEYECKFRKTILNFQESFDWDYEDELDINVLFGGVEL